MRKRITSALLTLVMLLSLVPAMGTTAAAADSTEPKSIGPSDGTAEVTIAIKGVQEGALAGNVQYEVKYKDGTTETKPQGPFLPETGKTPWSVRGTGRYLMEDSKYSDKFCAGMTYQLAIAADSIRNISSEKVKLVFEGSGITKVEGNGQRVIAGLSNDRSCYMVYVTIPSIAEPHTLHVDSSINHVYKIKDSGSGYEEITLNADRNLSYPEGTRLKFAVDQDYSVDADGTLKFLKGFVGKSTGGTASSPDSKFLGGNLKVVSRETREIVVQMGDRDASISTEFAKNEGLSKLNVIYLDVLPAIENGRRVTVVTPTSPEKRVDPKNPADKFATYTITGKTTGEWDSDNGGVYLYKKSTNPNNEKDGKYDLSFDLKLNGNYYCSNRSTELFINGKWVPNKNFSEVPGSPVYWSIENRKIEALGSSGWEIHITMNDFASQYYPAGSGYGLGLDDPMDFQKNSDNRYRYGVSGGVPADTTVGAYGSTEAASGQSCTVTFPVAVPESIREWNAKHSGEEQIGFTFLQNATGGVFVQDAAGGSYSPVPATYTVSDPDSDGNVTATATFTPENGKLYRVMGSVAATWQGKIVATTPADNSFIYVKGVAKNYLTGSVVYTSAVRYGDDVSIGRTGGLASIETEKLHYQWQCLLGSEWKDIFRATNGQLSKGKIAESLIGKQIRVKVTADGYEGVIYSEAKTVSKATWNQAPVAPIMTCEANGTDTYVPVNLSNRQDNQEYLTSSNTTMTDAELAASNQWGSDISATWARGNTLYIYTRMKETATHAAGTIYRYSTIYTGNVVDLKNLTLENHSGKIYVKKGESLTINVVGTPANANKWNNIYFIEQNGTAHDFTVKVDDGENNYIPAVTGTNVFRNHKITIASEKVGRHTLYAFPADTYNPYSTPFGTWQIVVYEPGNITDFDIIDSPTYADVTLSVGDSYTPENTNPTIRTNPDGVMNNYNLKWFVMTPATSTGTPTYSANNGYISVDENGVVTAIAANNGSSVDSTYKTVALCAVKSDGSVAKHIVSYHVTVTAATAPTLDSISIVPNEKTLTVGEDVTLTSVKYPANAEGTISWSSSNSSIASVDANGEVTAVSEGTTTITATCNGKTATCKVYVITEGHTHSYGDTWTKLDDTFHSKTCTANDDMLVEKHNWEVDTTQTNTEPTLSAPGEKHYKCSVCNATKTDVLAKLTAITDAGVSVTAPAYGDTPSGAYASSGEFSVASVDWQPTVSGSFAANTVYTVKVVLEITGSSNRFTNQTVFTINGQPATIVGAAPTAAGAESVTLTYKFPATGSGSSGGGGGSSTSSYAITVQSSKNGSVTADRKTASAGATVTLTVSPDKGYTLDDLTVLDKNDKEIKLTAKNGKYTFTMPASNVEVKATFKAAKSGNPFVDVPEGSYYEDAVIWAVDKGVTSGTDATHFTPNGICTRAQAVTFLWRAAGSPAPKSTTMPFTDVAQGSYYEQAVLWAVENGITKGTGDTTFSPNATCSRAQIVTFLWRSQKSPAAGSVNPFTDVSADAYYADAVLWAVKENVTSGTTATTFSPNADCTRAQIVTFIYRALAE